MYELAETSVTDTFHNEIQRDNTLNIKFIKYLLIYRATKITTATKPTTVPTIANAHAAPKIKQFYTV